MIAVSDAVLIVVSTAVLVTGLYRWQNNVEQAELANSRPAATAPANTQSNIAVNIPVQGVDVNRQDATAIVAPTTALTTPIERTVEDIVVVEPAPTSTIDVADDNATTASNNAIADVPPFGSYIVKSGDSLSLIAEQYGTTVRTLQEVNGIEGSLITVGQELRYPLPIN